MKVRAWSIVVETVVEAESADEARRDVGLLLAGVHPDHGSMPLSGPGSWAPNRYDVVEVFNQRSK